MGTGSTLSSPWVLGDKDTTSAGVEICAFVEKEHNSPTPRDGSYSSIPPVGSERRY
jgi:hypothetical protein